MRTTRRRIDGAAVLGLALTLVALCWLGAAPSAGAADILGPNVAIPFPLFPTDNPWNTRVDTLPVDPNSAAYLNSMGLGTGLHADFGTVWDGAPNGIPYVCVSGTQKKVPVSFDYADESDPGPYPIPSDAPIEGGPGSDGDRHVLVLDVDHQVLYELYAAYPQADGSWQAGSGAVFDLGSNALRPAGWTSADAAGLPILPGLVRYDEAVTDGVIDHALRFTVARTQKAYIYPATPLRQRLDRPRPAAHGPARASQGRLRHLGLLARGAGDPAGAQDLRHDRRRQRLELVRLRRPRPALERRRPARALSGQGQRFRGRRQPPARSPGRSSSTPAATPTCVKGRRSPAAGRSSTKASIRAGRRPSTTAAARASSRSPSPPTTRSASRTATRSPAPMWPR